MQQITLHNIPEDIEFIARQQAVKQGVSLSTAIISLLRKAVDMTQEETRKKAAKRDIDYFCGKWNDKEADAFNGHLKTLRIIDEDIWAGK